MPKFLEAYMSTFTINIFLYDIANPSVIYTFQIELYFYLEEQINSFEEQINSDYEDLLNSAGLLIDNENFENIENIENFENVGYGTENELIDNENFENIENIENFENVGYGTENGIRASAILDNETFDDFDWYYPSP